MTNRAHFEQELARSRERGDRLGMAKALEALARLAESEGDAEPASVLRDEAAALRREVPGSEGTGQTTATLLALTQAGDPRARDQLAARYIAVLRRFGHGRLPGRARDLLDTGDLVQVTIERALVHVREFKPQREGAFLAYLRRALINQVRDEIRRVSRGLERAPLTDSVADPGASPLEWTAEREAMERYEACLGQLPEDQQGAVMLRLEAGLSFPELAKALGKPSPDAGRMLFNRGLRRLARLMRKPVPRGGPFSHSA